MKNLNLFLDTNGAWITTSQILSTLEKVGAAEATILYIHTGMTFGPPNPALSRRELLAHLYELLMSLGVPTLCAPSFTFSFCNGEDYCVQTSRSRMGALNEYIRKLPDAVRSVDPLMSAVVVGKDIGLVQNLGKNSIGENSTFDKLHRHGAGVKFLFFGATVRECFTYTHYVEERLRAPYRYDRAFTGAISDSARTWQDTYTLFVRYKGVVPADDGKLENDLLRRGFLRKEICGSASISCIAEPAAYETIVEHLREDMYAYIAGDPRDRNTDFFARNMVAL
jgi:aminoglycoside 3-N-acetyltransferase